MNYQHTILTTATREEILQALTMEIRDWWTEDFSGVAVAVGDNFTVRFGNTFKILAVTVLSADNIEWTCMDSFIDMPDLAQKDEWKGTHIHWSITVENQECRLTMLHEGLTPEIACFEVCKQGWMAFLASLKSWLEVKKGQPYKIIKAD